MQASIQQPFSLVILSFLGAGLLPLAAAEETGTIKGSVDKPNLVTAVTVVNRQNDKKFTGKLDAKTGCFTIDNLLLGVTYDCIIDFAGARLEGVNLKVPRSDYEEEQPLTAEDIETIKEKVRGLNQFEDVMEILAVTGNIQHAAVLLNKVRTKPFYGSQPGEVIWRPELWHFERPEETWVKVQDDLFLVLYRERLQKKDFDKKSVTFDPALGGLSLTKKQSSVDLGTIQLPSKEPGIRLRSASKKASRGR
jgi:hypothetical protein